jgi:hypothetical protein
MRRNAIPIALALVAASPLPAAAQAAPAAAHPAADARAEATRLSAAMLPDVAFMSLIEPMFDALLNNQLAAEPAVRKLFTDRPELRGAMHEKVVPALKAIIGEALPGWRAELRDMLMQQLSGEDAKALADFLASSAGQKLYVGA